MGRGNECVTGKYEGLYFADKDYLEAYIKANDADEGPIVKLLGMLTYEEMNEYEFDYELSEEFYEEFVFNFKENMEKRFKSLSSTNETFGTVLENKLFKIVIIDNEWSYAVELLQKESEYGGNIEGLQAKHFKRYLEGIKESLLEIFPEIGTYTGPWTSGKIKRVESAA